MQPPTLLLLLNSKIYYLSYHRSPSKKLVLLGSYQRYSQGVHAESEGLKLVYKKISFWIGKAKFFCSSILIKENLNQHEYEIL